MQGHSNRRTYASLVPGTAAEQAVTSRRWERRGLLGRLTEKQPSRATTVPRRDQRAA